MKENDNKIKESESIKVILLGDSGVGKTNIILRYLKDEFNQNSKSSIGTTFGMKELKRNDIIYNLNIWDTTGQEVYRSVTKLFIQGSKIVILVYCINQKKSFESLDYWYNSIMEICGENVVLGIVGNKMDLFDDEEKVEVTEDEGQKYADEKKALFKLVSAKIDKKGIDSLFDQLFDKYIEENTVANSDKKERGRISISGQKSNKKDKKNKCC